jgi:hypothetical protein
MSKRKPKQPTRETHKQEVQQTIPKEGLTFGQKLWAIVVGVSTLVAIPAFVLMLVPRVVVSPPSEITDQENVFDVSFDISNAGFVTLEDAGACLAIGQLRGPQGLNPLHNSGFDLSTPRVCLNTWQHHNLGLDERFTVRLTDMFTRAAEADIAIVVSYHLPFIPITREKFFRFIATKDYYGKKHWRAWPPSEPRPAN